MKIQDFSLKTENGPPKPFQLATLEYISVSKPLKLGHDLQMVVADRGISKAGARCWAPLPPASARWANASGRTSGWSNRVVVFNGDPGDYKDRLWSRNLKQVQNMFNMRLLFWTFGEPYVSKRGWVQIEALYNHIF